MNYERDSIRRMTAYQWGEQPDSDDVLKLNTNENPYPPSPAAGQALADFDVTQLRRYPNATADALRRALANLHQLEIDNIVITHGGDEALRLALTTFVEPGSALGVVEPSYSLFPILAAVQGARTISVPLDDSWNLPRDFAQQLNEAGANLVCIVNPHAPSGTLMDVERISRLANDFNGVLLIDEAYVDFVEPALRHDLVRALPAFDNLLILRTFSKGYSLAGLRLGYLLGAASLIEPILNKTRDSYNIDQISQAIGCAAIADQPHAQDSWQKIRSARRQLRESLIELGFRVGSSQANFLLAEVPLDMPVAAEAIYQALKRSGILIRHFNTPIMEDKLRITVGTPEQNERLIEALQAMISSAK